MNFNFQLFLLSFLIYSVVCSFPKCEDIIQTGGDGKTNCAFCSSGRMQTECKSICDAKCKKSTSSSSTSSSSSSSNSNSGGNSNTGTAPKSNNQSPSSNAGSNSVNKNVISTSSKKKSSSSGSSSSSSSNSNSKKSSSSGSGGNNSKVSSSCNDIDPCVPIEEANRKYQERCKAEGLDDGCAKNCAYDAPFSQLKKAFLSHECEITEARHLLYAASNRKNNIKCCQEKGVLDGNRAGVCDCFCNPNCDQWPSKAEAKYLRCLSQFENIMHCHWASSRPS